MATMATLPAVKQKLDIPVTDVSLDNAIQAVLDGADRVAQEVTGYQADAEAARVDRFFDCAPDERLYLTRRPVSSITSATARDPGNSTTTTLTTDLVDGSKGYVWLVPDTTAFSPWLRPTKFKQKWDIVVVTYVVTATTAPPRDLSDAIAELAAFWFKHDRANAESITAGPFSESFITDRPMPERVSQIFRHYSRKVSRIVGGS